MSRWKEPLPSAVSIIDLLYQRYIGDGLRGTSFILLAFLLFLGEAHAQRPPTDEVLKEEICKTLNASAVQNELPVEFFMRLIWQESKFDPHARSSKGALGIAQFMPRTAQSRGLIDPLQPSEALRESASFLSELRNTFGNLGLAAAAYNAGAGRVSAWLAGRAVLPGETQAFVRIITGRSAEEWAQSNPPQWESSSLPQGIPCTEVANLIVENPQPKTALNPVSAPWGVLIAGNWGRGKVMASFEQLRRQYPDILGEREPLVLRLRARALFYSVRIPESSRGEANRLCAKLRSRGAACVVLRNPTATRNGYAEMKKIRAPSGGPSPTGHDDPIDPPPIAETEHYVKTER